jgi:hypothetical protein
LPPKVELLAVEQAEAESRLRVSDQDGGVALQKVYKIDSREKVVEGGQGNGSQTIFCGLL